MKKLLALLVAGVMSVSLLTACGGDTGSSQPSGGSTPASTPAEGSNGGEAVQLTFAWWGNQTRNERTQAVLDMYTENNPNVTFDPQFNVWDDYWTKLATASAGHTLPDLVQMDYQYLEQYVDSGLLVDLTPYINDGTIDVSNVGESTLNTGKVGDGIYAICAGVNVPALLYNKTLLEENNIEIHDNMTTEEFIALSKEIYEKTGYKTNIGYGTDELVVYFARAYGEVMYESDKIGASVETLEKFYSLYEQGLKEGWLYDAQNFAERSVGSVEQDPLIYGSSPETMSWCFFAWSNQFTATQSNAPEGVEIGMTTWPSDNPAVSDFIKPSQFFALSTDGTHQAEAAKVLDFLTNSIECNNVLLGERGVPISTVVAEAISVNQTEADRQIAAFIADVVTPNSTTLNPPAPATAAQAYTLNDELVEKVCYGQLTAAEAAKQMFEGGNTYLAG